MSLQDAMLRLEQAKQCAFEAQEAGDPGRIVQALETVRLWERIVRHKHTATV